MFTRKLISLLLINQSIKTKIQWRIKMTSLNQKLRLSCGATILCFAPLATAAQTASSGCGSDPLMSGVYQLESGGVTRVYQLHIPEGYSRDTPMPMVTLFHGWGGDETAFLGESSVVALADERGYILVAPRGLGAEGGDDSYASFTFNGSSTGVDGDGNAICDFDITGDYSYASCKVEGAEVAQNTCSWTQCQADDFDGVVALIEKVSAEVCIDSDRVYAMGGSNGGMFTWGLGQDARTAPLLRAIAPLMGLPHRGYLDGPARDGLPVMVITGTLDPTVPPGEWEDPSYSTTSDGDVYYYTGATAITRVWAEGMACNTEQPAQSVASGSEEIDCRSYCDAGGPSMPPVMDCRIEMDHSDYRVDITWPLMLDFFDAHSSR